MKDPDHISTVFRVTCDGCVIDTHDNYAKTLEGAIKRAASFSKLPGREYEIVEITTIETIHQIP